MGWLMVIVLALIGAVLFTISSWFVAGPYTIN